MRKGNYSKHYYAYLSSSAWQRKRVVVLNRAGYRCERCTSDAQPLHVHHKTYERLGDELPEDLTVLCKKCHEKEHQKQPKKKKTKPAPRQNPPKRKRQSQPQGPGKRGKLAAENERLHAQLVENRARRERLRESRAWVA